MIYGESGMPELPTLLAVPVAEFCDYDRYYADARYQPADAIVGSAVDSSPRFALTARRLLYDALEDNGITLAYTMPPHDVSGRPIPGKVSVHVLNPLQEALALELVQPPAEPGVDDTTQESPKFDAATMPSPLMPLLKLTEPSSYTVSTLFKTGTRGSKYDRIKAGILASGGLATPFQTTEKEISNAADELIEGALMTNIVLTLAQHRLRNNPSMVSSYLKQAYETYKIAYQLGARPLSIEALQGLAAGVMKRRIAETPGAAEALGLAT
ncbi:hypothetical protein BH09PAT3_BH09PAT3_0860 [soil metagenome]